jgi:D-3-phosphoglycerate dehydrogenase
MILQRKKFDARFAELGWRVHVPEFEQTLSEEELVELVPRFDGWIIGDDPASRRVIEAGAAGKLKAAVKWGVGVDNVDFEAFAESGVPVANTPGMFGQEVADVALGYVIALARRTFEIDRGVRAGGWPKPAGISLAGKTVALIGFGDIGRNTAKRLAACDMRVVVCDPASSEEAVARAGYEAGHWPTVLAEADFVVFTCALTPYNRHMLNDDSLSRCKPGLRVVNVARGPLINEASLIRALNQRTVEGCALDVFEVEPLTSENALRRLPAVILGSHNASNTIDAVWRTSVEAIRKLNASLDRGAQG